MTSGSGVSPAGRVDPPLVDGDAVDGADDGRAHDEAVRGEQAGRVGEEAGAVAVDDVDAVGATEG